MQNSDYLIVTSFNQKLYDLYAFNFLKTFNLPFDLKIYSEKKPLVFSSRLNVNNLKKFNIKKKYIFREDKEFSNFVSKYDVGSKKKNILGGLSDMLTDTVRFSYKVFSLINAFNEYKNDYKYIVWIDADFIFKKKFDHKFLSIMTDESKFMSYMGREGTYSECGFLIFNTQNKYSDLYFKEIRNLYLNGDIFKLPETHDSYIWDFLRKEFENKYEDFKNINITELSYNLLKNYDLIDKKYFLSYKSNHNVLEKTILFNYMYHLKGNRKFKLKKISSVPKVKRNNISKTYINIEFNNFL